MEAPETPTPQAETNPPGSSAVQRRVIPPEQATELAAACAGLIKGSRALAASLTAKPFDFADAMVQASLMDKAIERANDARRAAGLQAV